MLDDPSPAPDELLPATGISHEREKLLSAPFIVDTTYGTRSSTLITIARSGDIEFVERTFGPNHARLGEVREGFRIVASSRE